MKTIIRLFIFVYGATSWTLSISSLMSNNYNPKRKNSHHCFNDHAWCTGDLLQVLYRAYMTRLKGKKRRVNQPKRHFFPPTIPPIEILSKTISSLHFTTAAKHRWTRFHLQPHLVTPSHQVSFPQICDPPKPACKTLTWSRFRRHNPLHILPSQTTKRKSNPCCNPQAFA